MNKDHKAMEVPLVVCANHQIVDQEDRRIIEGKNFSMKGPSSKNSFFLFL